MLFTRNASRLRKPVSSSNGLDLAYVSLHLFSLFPFHLTAGPDLTVRVDWALKTTYISIDRSILLTAKALRRPE